MEEKTQVSVAFFTDLADRYDHPLIKWWMKKFQSGALEEIDLNKPSFILDASCGTGELLKTLQQCVHKKTRLVGVDITDSMLAIARKKLLASVKLEKQDVHHLKYKNCSFDYVISTEAFHHYALQKTALKEFVRVAKKKVIVVDVNFFLPALHQLFAIIEPGCVKINTRKEMRQLFEEAGLKNIKQQRNFLFSIVTVGEK